MGGEFEGEKKNLVDTRRGRRRRRSKRRRGKGKAAESDSGKVVKGHNAQGDCDSSNDVGSNLIRGLGLSEITD